VILLRAEVSSDLSFWGFVVMEEGKDEEGKDEEGKDEEGKDEEGKDEEGKDEEGKECRRIEERERGQGVKAQVHICI
jgi:hypothetical protein